MTNKQICIMCDELLCMALRKNRKDYWYRDAATCKGGKRAMIEIKRVDEEPRLQKEAELKSRQERQERSYLEKKKEVLEYEAKITTEKK